MIKRDVALYTYRIHVLGGHSFICLAEQDNIMDFRDEIKDLRDRGRALESCYISSDNRIIPLCAESSSITAIDAPLDRPPIILEEHRNSLKAQKYVPKSKEKEVRKITPGQTVSRRR
ncbi:hypothetical protein N8Z24_00030 [bacterium]|nr:hypothetical protein [bacterium]